MTPRFKKLIGVLLISALLFAWVIGAVTIADHVPAHWLAQLIFFAIAGVGWAAPAIPLIKWINAKPKGTGA
jgi:hypothetical protein